MDQDFTKFHQKWIKISLKWTKISQKFTELTEILQKMDQDFTKFHRLDQDFEKKEKRPRMGPGRLPVQKFGAKTRNLAKSGLPGPIPGPKRAKTEKKILFFFFLHLRRIFLIQLPL